MAQPVSLLNTNSFIFVTVIVLGVVILAIYMSIAPEKTVPYNFDPFPNEAPSALPDPTHSTDQCWNKLTPCDASGQCSACSLGQYQCVQVTQPNFYHFNGINVPTGNWCLPQDNNPNPNPPCNMYTGRWIWTFDPEYCSSVSPGSSQCWKCECLYPSLFTGSEQGCNVQVACQNTSIKSNSLQQPENQLIASPFAMPSLQGQTWNPTASTGSASTSSANASPSPFTSGSASSIYDFTPYDQDQNGNPWFQCNCPSNAGGQFFDRLPNDPYTCHLEPCSTYVGSDIKALQCQGENCTCQCQGNFATSPNGIYQGSCVLVTDACGHFGYDNQQGQCLCGEGPYWPRECRSDITEVNIDKDVPACAMPQNALGSECINPCEGAICYNGSPCISCGPQSYPAVDQCGFNPDGSLQTAGLPTHSTCDCQAATAPMPPNSQNYGGWFGPTCGMNCLKGGTALFWYTFPESPQYSPNSCNCCCSLSKYTEQDEWYLSYGHVCDDGVPSSSSPPDSDCIPVPTYSGSGAQPCVDTSA